MEIDGNGFITQAWQILDSPGRAYLELEVDDRNIIHLNEAEIVPNRGTITVVITENMNLLGD